MSVSTASPQVSRSFSPPSSCPLCGHKIRFYENIPILSYLFLRGKCSSCKIRISARYPAIEALTGLLFVLVLYYFGFKYGNLDLLVVCCGAGDDYLYRLRSSDHSRCYQSSRYCYWFYLLFFYSLVQLAGFFTRYSDRWRNPFCNRLSV